MNEACGMEGWGKIPEGTIFYSRTDQSYALHESEVFFNDINL